MTQTFTGNASYLNNGNDLIVVLGHGQLARMMYLGATQLGLNIIAVDATNRVCVNAVDKTVLDLTVEQAFEACKAITSEFEHLPKDLVKQAEDSGKFKPNAQAIAAGADRIIEKSLLEKLDIPNCPHQIINSVSDLQNAYQNLGPKLILKTSRDGYDGYGQWRIFSEQDLAVVCGDLVDFDFEHMPLVAEQCILFEREISLLGVTDIHGEHKYYPLTENHHGDGQLVLSLAPAPNLTPELQQRAEAIHKTMAEALNYCGVLAIELFQTGDQLLVNEIAPRVHNSGHWTQQGCAASQFENHIRAVAGLPLGDTSARHLVAMVNYVGEPKPSSELLKLDNAHLHWYDKSVRSKRKMGHINLVADSVEELQKLIGQVHDLLPESLATNLAEIKE
ncbi:5-(carboxyamino)imidazole ribonucleotide synthase [Psychrosphaera sp. F3M07]|uniref:5-(carboxyamino)imidazole ribonucleotide synthase n=1 Tax=Psychrosphaera sp. F3M07 TaxID=2841560 RepID=UPI001C0A1CFB|nr:5-(carboxyamino)imidazole ribonucleotide synthase [Psychrosphaera sp. F3M07]MBU2917276.1 5-(carboxyamino)imidazole ribonucleotide synthase [Psychrosphaera sp. F3M07]